jgi:ribosomal protein S18 acetylase RimI-like enzyme
VDKNVILKKCGLKDLEELVSLGRTTYFEAFHAMNTQETMSKYLDEAFNKRKIEDELQNTDSQFVLACRDAEAVAYLKVNFPPSQTDINDQDSIEIERIYVKKEFTDIGIGKNLIQHSIDIGRKHGCSYAWLGVWAKNVQAIQFYEKMGFVVSGKHYFRMGDELQSDLILNKQILNPVI